MQDKSRLFYCGEIVKLATPILGVRILYIAVSFIGMLLIAHLGKQQLAAGALVAALCNTVMVIAMSPLLAVSITVSRVYGQGKHDEVGKEVRQAWLVSLGLGLLGSLLFWNLSSLLVYLRQPAELQPLMQPYFRAMAWGVIPSMLLASCYQIFFPIKRGKLVVYFSALNLGGTTVLGYGLIHGSAGLPALGMSGWAYGTSIMNWVLAVGVFSYLFLAREFAVYRLFDFKHIWDRPRLMNFFHISFPITVQFSSELLAFSAINLMVGWLGVGALSVQQILIQCSTVALMIPMGAGQAATILISYAVGRREYDAIREIGTAGLMLVSGCMLGVALLYWLAPFAVIGLYLDLDAGDNAALAKSAVILLALLGLTQIADGARNMLVAALRGMQDAWYPMWINMGLLWGFGLPLSYILAFPLHQGQFGLNLGFLIAFALGAALMLARFLRKAGDLARIGIAGQPA